MLREPSVKPSSPESVEAFLESLNHPLKAEVAALRQVLLEADPSIREGIKWNVPSFRTEEYFATLHLRRPDRLGVILHLGAKKRDLPALTIPDPHSLLKWLAPDRAEVGFHGLAEIEAKRPAFSEIIRHWIAYVE